MDRREQLGLGGGAAAGAVVGMEAEPASESAINALLGDFRHTGEKADTEARDEAIDDVVKAMNPLVRSVAQSRLKEASPIQLPKDLVYKQSYGPA